MTLEEIAHTAGVTTDTLGRIARTQSEPKWTTVRAIAQALAVSLVELAEAVEAEASNRERRCTATNATSSEAISGLRP